MSQDTSQNNKRIAKNSIILYFRTFITMLVGMFTTRVVLKTLGEVDLGLYNVIGGVVMMLASIQGSLSVASSRFLTYTLGKGNEVELKETFQSVFTVHFILAIISVAVFETIGLYLFYNLNIPEERMYACWVCYQFSVITSFLTLLSIPFTSIVIAHEQMGFYAYLTFLDVLLKLLILYVIIYFPYDKLITYGALLLATTIIGIVVNVIYSYRKYKETSVSLLLSREKLIPILNFSGWTAIGNFSFTLADQGGNYLLNIFFSPAINAARMLSMQVNSITSRFIQGFQTAVNPQIIKSYAQKDFRYMHKLIYTSSRFSFLTLFILGFSIYFTLPELLSLWLGEYPEYTIPFVRIILVRTLFSVALSNPLQTALNATASLCKTNTAISICYLIILAVTFICLKLGSDAISVFIISLLFNIVIVIIRVIILGKLIELSFKDYFNNVFFKTLIPCAITILIFIIANSIWHIENVLTRLLFPFFLSIATIFIIGLTKEERNCIIHIASKFPKNKYYNKKNKYS